MFKAGSLVQLGIEGPESSQQWDGALLGADEIGVIIETAAFTVLFPWARVVYMRLREAL